MSSAVDRVSIAAATKWPVSIVAASRWHVDHIASRIRDVDRREIKAATGLCPELAMRLALARQWRRTVTAIDDVEGPVAMGGIEMGAAPRDGIVWLVGTDWLDRHPSTLLRLARIWLERFDKDYDFLWNYVHERNERAIRWLEVLGFEIQEPQPYGTAQEPFCYFSRRIR